MTTDILRAKILDECDTRLKKGVTLNELKDITEIYAKLTERDWFNHTMAAMPWTSGYTNTPPTNIPEMDLKDPS